MKQARAARLLLSALFFLGWALLFTYPLLAHLTGGVVLSAGGDAWLHLWDLWWADKSVIGLHQNPYFTNYLYYPTGVSLAYHSLDIVNGVISIPLQQLLGLTTSFNLLLIANLTLDGLAAYWLCLEATGAAGAALVGGALFASTPLLGTSVNLGQLDEVTAWWLPLYVMSLWRALDSPGAVWQRGGGRRAALCAGLCLAGASLATWYFTAGLAIFTLIFVPAYIVARDRGAGPGGNGPGITVWWHAATKVGVAVALFVIVLSPLLVAMTAERLSGATYMLPSYETTVQNSADLAGLFLPGGAEVGSVDQHGSNVSLGLLGLALGIAGLAGRWHKAWPVGLALLGIALMALGPHLQLFGVDTNVPMPYALLDNVPFLGASRQPLRFLATAGICLSVLAAFGVAYLLGVTRQPALRLAIVPALLVLSLVEFFGIPRAITGTSIGPAYSFIKVAQAPGAVMELPYALWQTMPQFYQSLHERPIVGGYTSRHFPYPFIEAAPGAAQLADGFPATLDGSDIISPTIQQTALASLDYYGVRYAVLHKGDLVSGRFGRLVSLLGVLYPSGPVYDDPQIAVYETPMGSAAAAPNDKLPLVGLGRGWHDVEANPTRRWTGSDPGNGDAYVWIGIRPTAGGQYSLSLDTFAYGTPRHLSLVLNGKTLLKKVIGLAPETLQVDLGDLTVGDYGLVLKVDEQPTMPPGDRRFLSLGVTRLQVARRGPE